MTNTATYHVPVLAREVVELLHGANSVLDCTLGGGGHAAALLDAGDVRHVTGVDRDQEAIQSARVRLRAYEEGGRFHSIHANFSQVADRLPADARFDGILMDLGVSSHQFDSEERGFTFREGAPLDMRMGRSDDSETAADVLNDSAESRLAQVFRAYGDEPRAARLAREVVRRRETQAFATSDDFVRAIRGALGPRCGPPDFARLFQALRIAVNHELEGLTRALPALRDRLAPSGVFAVITYHSGEDRLVKHAFREWSASCICPPRQPVCTCRGHPLGETITRRAVTAGDVERESNPRSRSARLRAWRMRGETT